MKILGILAGPRKGRAADKMIDAVLKGLASRDSVTEKICLYDCDIQPCRGCGICGKTGKCPIKDDQRLILEKMGRSDVVVFGSPVYWSNVTSEAKKFMDRAGPFFEMTAMGPKRVRKVPGRIVIVTACGAPWPFSHLMGIIPGAERAMKAFFGRMNARISTLYAAGMVDTDTSDPTPRQLRKAYALGKKIRTRRGPGRRG